jgi:anthranilate phosphoribosyltransferase
LKAGHIAPITIDPVALGHGHNTLDGLQVSTAEASAALIRSALDNDASQAGLKARSMMALNAGAGIYVSGLVDSLAEGVERAEIALASGEAARQLARFVAFTQDLSHSAASDSSL